MKLRCYSSVIYMFWLNTLHIFSFCVELSERILLSMWANFDMK
uniref:Uncharacterized protein n=1 Tax=Rhizophora mucronata TaxID=61149 RepID=A0A2P2PR61_RHIMU